MNWNPKQENGSLALLGNIFLWYNLLHSCRDGFDKLMCLSSSKHFCNSNISCILKSTVVQPTHLHVCKLPFIQGCKSKYEEVVSWLINCTKHRIPGDREIVFVYIGSTFLVQVKGNSPLNIEIVSTKDMMKNNDNSAYEQ